MSRFWPKTEQAEDQSYSRSILYTHVLTRGLQVGSLAGTGIGTSVFLLRNYKIVKQSAIPSSFATTLLRSTGVGAVIGTGMLSVGLPMMMRGKEPIEWQDRSYRLLYNKGQVECDDWTYTGMLVGGTAAALKGGHLGWRGVAGGVGAGSIAGMLGYMGWRYGVKGGKFEEEKL